MQVTCKWYKPWQSFFPHRLTGAVPQWQYLNHYSINFTIQNQLCQYLIFSLNSFSRGQHANKLPYAGKNSKKKSENCKLCGTQTSRWCIGSTLKTEMMNSGWILFIPSCFGNRGRGTGKQTITDVTLLLWLAPWLVSLLSWLHGHPCRWQTAGTGGTARLASLGRTHPWSRLCPHWHWGPRTVTWMHQDKA